MADIEAVLFDFGGTLDHDGVDWFSRFYGHIQDCGGGVEREVFQACADRAAASLCDDADVMELLMEGIVGRLCERAHQNVEKQLEQTLPWSGSQIAERFLADARQHLAKNKPIVEEVAQRFRVGCISNNWGNTAGWCEQFELARTFEVMIDSERVGAAKPDERIFLAALEQLNLRAEVCVYVGDRFDCDVLGSRGVGMTPVWITQGAYYGQYDPADPVVRISQLEELPEALDRLCEDVSVQR